MRIVSLLVAILAFASFAEAQDIQVCKPILVGKAPVKVRKYDFKTKAWAEVDGYKYAFVVMLKNVSERPLIVVTKGLGQQTAPGEAKQNVMLDMVGLTAVDGAKVIPSRDDLRLVEIRSGEAAGMNVEFQTEVPLEEVVVTYSPKDFYDGRFEYWTGKVSSEPLKLENK